MIETVTAKRIVNRAQRPESWFGCDYNMNIYRGCCHGCIYCDSRSECYGIRDFGMVRAKENALEMIEYELKNKRKKGVIGTGAMSDPYNPFEQELLLTRNALECIAKNRFGVCLATKSALVSRDTDVFLDISSQAPVCVKVTVTTADDGLCRKLEPNVSVTSERFRAIEALAKAGIFTGILLMPVLPFINDTVINITRIVQRAADCGASFVFPMFGVTLRENQRDYFFSQLDRDFPSIKAKYMETFGNQYECVSPAAASLWEAFEKLCRRYGLLYRMPDIIRAYIREERTVQLSLL